MEMDLAPSQSQAVKDNVRNKSCTKYSFSNQKSLIQAFVTLHPIVYPDVLHRQLELILLLFTPE